MKNYKRACAAVGIIFIVGILVSLFYMRTVQPSHIDLLAANEIAKEAGENWNNLSVLQNMAFGEDFLITDSAGSVVYATKDCGVHSYYEAIGRDYPHIQILSSGTVCGELFILQERGSEVFYAKKSLLLLYIGITFATFVVLGMFWHYVNHSIVRPFLKMKQFASEIAGGNLDITLGREKNNLFGDFTESFDIMREELRSAKMREEELKVREKELVAELSHDLKTPVTGIKLTAELLEAKLSDAYAKEKMHHIYQKADQIDSMINDLFATTLSDLGEIQISCCSLNCMELTDMVKKADDRELCRIQAFPECMVQIDPKRMQQIISNVVNNAYKYANTEIEVQSKINGGYLEMRLRDFGPGVSPDEIHLVTNKYFRGSSEDVRLNEGSGLGLHIAKTLMERMNGELLCANADPGFLVRLLIPLA